MTATELPTGPEGLELEMLSETLSSQVPGAALEAFRVVDSHLWGSGDASSAGRIDIEVGPDGALYFGTVGDFGGAIMRLVPESE